jgi:hypothetical protein
MQCRLQYGYRLLLETSGVCFDIQTLSLSTIIQLQSMFWPQGPTARSCCWCQTLFQCLSNQYAHCDTSTCVSTTNKQHIQQPSQH